MVNATLWYAVNSGDLVNTVPASQKIEFTTKDRVLEPLENPYDNNIKQIPNPTNDGTRIINVTENGLKQYTYPLKGFIKLSDPNVSKLFSFRALQQITTNLPFGRFGIDYPNAPDFSFTPLVTRGLSIGPANLKHNATNASVDFEYTLLFGGRLF